MIMVYDIVTSFEFRVARSQFHKNQILMGQFTIVGKNRLLT